MVSTEYVHIAAALDARQCREAATGRLLDADVGRTRLGVPQLVGKPKSLATVVHTKGRLAPRA